MQIITNVPSTFTFGDKMWVGAHILTHIPGRRQFEKEQSQLVKYNYYFLVSLRGMEYNQKRDCTLYFYHFIPYDIEKDHLSSLLFMRKYVVIV